MKRKLKWISLTRNITRDKKDLLTISNVYAPKKKTLSE